MVPPSAAGEASTTELARDLWSTPMTCAKGITWEDTCLVPAIDRDAKRKTFQKASRGIKMLWRCMCEFHIFWSYTWPCTQQNAIHTSWASGTHLSCPKQLRLIERLGQAVLDIRWFWKLKASNLWNILSTKKNITHRKGDAIVLAIAIWLFLNIWCHPLAFPGLVSSLVDSPIPAESLWSHWK